jgi:hypothetical protein
MQSKTFAAVKRLGLVSLMNKTKWLEIAEKISAVGENGPICRYKHIAEERIYGPSYIHWNEFIHFPSEIYEWLEIYRDEKISQGALVDPLVIDNSQKIESILRLVGTQFSFTENGFKIWGYVDPSRQPAYA